MLAFLAGPLGKYVIYAALILGAIAVFFGLKHEYDEGKRDEGRAEIQALWDADKSARLKAFTDQVTQNTILQEQAEKAAKALDAEHQARINDAKRRASVLPPAVTSAPFPAAAVGVLNNAIGDTGSASGAPAKPSESSTAAAADSSVGAVTDWALVCIDLYNSARDQVIQLQGFYNNLRASTKEIK